MLLVKRRALPALPQVLLAEWPLEAADGAAANCGVTQIGAGREWPAVVHCRAYFNAGWHLVADNAASFLRQLP